MRHSPAAFPAADRHDIAALALTVLINLTEHSAENRAALAPKAAGPLVQLFARRALAPADDAGDQHKQSSRDQTFDNVVGAYAGILMGCLCRGQPDVASSMQAALPGGKFEAVVSHLGDYLYFQQAAGIDAKDVESVKTVVAELQAADAVLVE